jgi:thiamine-phosphate pyrophosphorylase
MRNAAPRDIDLTLYAIVDLAVVPTAACVELALAAVRGGAGVVQLRGKQTAAGELLRVAGALVTALAPSGVPLLVNDRVDVAALAGAGGVHLGDDDLPLEAAAELLAGGLLGRTCRDAPSAERAIAGGAGYLGVGSVFESGTKQGIPVIGLDGLRAVTAAASVPVVAIGGIDEERGAACMAAGAAGVAVIGALFGDRADATRVEERARSLRAALDAARSRAATNL